MPAPGIFQIECRELKARRKDVQRGCEIASGPRRKILDHLPVASALPTVAAATPRQIALCIPSVLLRKASSAEARYAK
jgi:hypothetical protein